MIKIQIILVAIGMVFGLSAMLPGEKVNKPKRVVLLGASVGREWNISSLPERVKSQNIDFEYVGGSGFDKTDVLKEILTREQNKPDVVCIKECAAYFPGDLEHYKSLMNNWITLCIKEDVVPVPTTVVPVTRLHSFKQMMIDVIKGRNPLKRGNPLANRRNQAILEYNDWIRFFAEKQGLVVLDLEAAVRYSETNRFLREDFAKIDGLHLNRKAYNSLDMIVIPTLAKIDEESSYDAPSK